MVSKEALAFLLTRCLLCIYTYADGVCYEGRFEYLPLEFIVQLHHAESTQTDSQYEPDMLTWLFSGMTLDTEI